MPGTTWSKFYWADWQSDKGLRMCSLAARGLWMEMLCIAAEADPVGYVMINGVPLSPEQLARQVGASVEEVERLLAELLAAGVYSVTRASNRTKIAGEIAFSRRLIRDEKRRKASAKGGKIGGAHAVANKSGIHAAPDDTPDDTPPSTPHDPTDATTPPMESTRVQSPEEKKDDVVKGIPEPRAQLDPAYRPDWAKRDLRRVSNGNIDETSAGITDLSPIEAMLADGADWELDVLEIVRTDVRALRQPMRSWRAPWFRQAVFDRRAERLRGQGVVVLDTPIERRERERIDADRLAARKTIAKLWLETGYWPDACGVEPPRNEEFPIAFLEQVADANGLKLSTRLPASILRKVPPV